MVHIVSILNLTRYETQVNRQWINIILKELTKSKEDIRALFNITNQLAQQVQVQNIILHLRAMLANLRDCLHFMKQLANHVLEYIDTATTSTLIPHLIPIPDLQQMLYRIESELPPNMHLPIPSSDPLHFYRYLRMHMLVEENQFLLLIDIPIQDRAQQIQIYQIINLPVPVGNYSMRYTMDTKYLGVTYDRTKAMDIPEEQFKLCKEANGQFCPLTTPLQPLTNPPSCVAALYTKNSRAAWKPPALIGFLSLCRKDKNNTKMDDEDMDGPIYRPSGIIPTVIRPQESHGLCVIPQPAQKKDRRK